MVTNWLLFTVWVKLRSVFGFFFFKQKTAYEMRISDWSSDVCSSDLSKHAIGVHVVDAQPGIIGAGAQLIEGARLHAIFAARTADDGVEADGREALAVPQPDVLAIVLDDARRAILLSLGIVADESFGRFDRMIVDAEDRKSTRLNSSH